MGTLGGVHVVVVHHVYDTWVLRMPTVYALITH